MGAKEFYCHCMESVERRVQQFLMNNNKNLPQSKMLQLRQSLQELNSEQLDTIECLEFKDPTMLLIISVLLGYLGIDRFMLGDIALGILKLITGGGCLIWWLIDLFFVTEKTKEYNFQKVKTTIKYA